MKITGHENKRTAQTFRSFIAIEVPAEIRRQIGAHIDQLRAKFADVRASWSREDNLHLTLKFLGDIEVSRIEAISQACVQATRNISPFELRVTGCGSFPPQGKPKVLWIGVRYAGAPPTGSPEPRTTESTISAKRGQIAPVAESPLLSLHAAIESSCAAAGFAREGRPFHPHLTIGRIREQAASRPLAEYHRQSDFVAKPFTVSEIVLFRSELSSKGSKYTALSHCRLG